MKEHFDFSKQPKSKEEEIAWLKNVIWMFHLRLNKRKDYRELKLENEYHWIPLFCGLICMFEEKMGIKLTSYWYITMKEYEYFPEAWNSLPFKLKINKDWGLHLQDHFYKR